MSNSPYTVMGGGIGSIHHDRRRIPGDWDVCAVSQRLVSSLSVTLLRPGYRMWRAIKMSELVSFCHACPVVIVPAVVNRPPYEYSSANYPLMTWTKHSQMILVNTPIPTETSPTPFPPPLSFSDTSRRQPDLNIHPSTLAWLSIPYEERSKQGKDKPTPVPLPGLPCLLSQPQEPL
ncbi:hypothetical protein RRG08_045110 [Elysia crispata]|uniref:Uncharacterized protein n=1 Tax=Elysia crispata TaxID=231223 RepID=A0AAE1D4X2_9GAST|nr:hypothetical protein RRG08_045110 [Elysia crispata]